MTDDVDPILRRPRVETVTGDSRSGIYNKISEGLFPKPVHLGPRAVGWPASEVAAINAARIGGRSDEEIRRLVTKLEADRRRGAPTSAGLRSAQKIRVTGEGVLSEENAGDSVSE